MLAAALMRGQPIETYIDPTSPVQQSIVKTFAEMCGIGVDEVVVATDGCSAPTFAAPLQAAALAYARLADPTNLSSARAEACGKIWKGMTGNSDMVAGPGRFDTQFMTKMKGRALSKAGAEGYEGISLPDGKGKGIGIVIKVSDGDLDWRASGMIAVEILRQLGLISNADAETFDNYAPHPIYNWRKLTVGEIRPCFKLQMH
jgi:L-asparaginase II